MAITVTVMYPNTSGSKFDMDYYLGSHFDLVGKLLGHKLSCLSVTLRPRRYMFSICSV